MPHIFHSSQRVLLCRALHLRCFCGVLHITCFCGNRGCEFAESDHAGLLVQREEEARRKSGGGGCCRCPPSGVKWADPLYPAAAEVDEGRFVGVFFGTSPSWVKWAGPAVQPYRVGGGAGGPALPAFSGGVSPDCE